MYAYVAYGLGIHSALPLPELMAAPESEADVVIRLGKVEHSPPTTDEGIYLHRSAAEACFFWKEMVAFEVRAGKEIIVEPFAGVEEELIRLPLLGMVLGAVLQQRGILALHASAVGVNGCAVAFLGNMGRGKSTIAAALYARGHRLLADDLVALEMSEMQTPMVMPGFPQIKLYPQPAAAALGEEPERLPRSASGSEKRFCSAARGFSGRPLPLRRMYVLCSGSGPAAIEPLQPQAAILQLIGQSYAARFYEASLQGAEAARHFLQCANLAKEVPICWLKRRRSLAQLPDLARLVEEDLSRNH